MRERNMLTKMIAKQQKDRDALFWFWKQGMAHTEYLVEHFLITRLLVFIILFLLFALFVSCTNNSNFLFLPF